LGRAEIGAAWSKRSEEGRDYPSLKLDDPSFNTPIYANLFDDKDGESYTLIWSRPRKNNADSPANFSMRETWRYSSRSASEMAFGNIVRIYEGRLSSKVPGKWC
jgi:hypothetical protein